MKKLSFLILLIFCLTNFVNAENMPDIKYKNIRLKDKISFDLNTNTWSKTVNKKNKNFYTKTKGFGSFYDYVDSNKDFAFSTNCEYDFIYNDSLMCYSNRNMKFYEILYDTKTLGKRELTKEEVEAILPNYQIVSLSDFSSKTNSLKIKKGLNELNVFLFNDTEKTFDNYIFTSGNAKFEQYDLRGFLKIHKPGMIQFSEFGEQNNNWYVLLIR